MPKISIEDEIRIRNILHKILWEYIDNRQHIRGKKVKQLIRKCYNIRDSRSVRSHMQILLDENIITMDDNILSDKNILLDNILWTVSDPEYSSYDHTSINELEIMFKSLKLVKEHRERKQKEKAEKEVNEVIKQW